MNCKDIARMLDERDVYNLHAREQADVRAHLATCRNCARDWQIHVQLSKESVPAVPAELLVQFSPQVRAATESGQAVRNRWVLVGTVLALGAAAAMLAMRLREPAAPPELVESSSMPVVQPVEAQDVPESPATVAPDAQPAAQVRASQAVEPGARTFTVQILPFKNNAVDASRKAALETIYATLVDGLSDVPGLTRVEPMGGSEATAKADYVISLWGGALSASSPFKGDYVMNMIVHRTGPNGHELSDLQFGATGEIAQSCADTTPMEVLASRTSCADPINVGRQLLATLRKSVFPLYAPLQRDIQARLFDQSRDPTERLWALLDLQSLGTVARGGMFKVFPQSLRDPSVVQAAIQLASIAPDPATRAQVWYTLRGSGDPMLLRPLVAALGTDSDVDTRVQALATLAADFADEPQARGALETASVGDTDPFVRALAQRALGAESSWTRYVLATLKDTSRPPMERVKAFFYAYGLPTTRRYGSFSLDGSIVRVLDDAAMRALTEILPRAAADSSTYGYASFVLVSELRYVEHPAITDMLLDSLDPGSTWLDRSLAVEALRRRTDDSRVRVALEKIAAEDPDPKLRELAGKPPGSEEEFVAAMTMSPTLGVVADHLEAGPDVPAELVGKLSVVRMATGSPADRAGMKEADVLLEIDERPITSGPQLIEVLDALPRDVDFRVVVSRNGQIVRLTARL